MWNTDKFSRASDLKACSNHLICHLSSTVLESLCQTLANRRLLPQESMKFLFQKQELSSSYTSNTASCPSFPSVFSGNCSSQFWKECRGVSSTSCFVCAHLAVTLYEELTLRSQLWIFCKATIKERLTAELEKGDSPYLRSYAKALN